MPSTSATSRSATAARSAARSPTADPASDLPAWLSRSTTRVVAALVSAASGPSRSTASSRARSRPALAPDELLIEIRRGPLPRGAAGRLPEARAAGVRLLDRRAWPRSSSLGRRRRSATRQRRADRGRRRRLPGEGRRGGPARAATDRRRRSRRRPAHATDGQTSTATSTPTASIARPWPSSTPAARSRPRWGASSADRAPASHGVQVQRVTPGRRVAGAAGRRVLARDLRSAASAGPRAAG